MIVSVSAVKISIAPSICSRTFFDRMTWQTCTEEDSPYKYATVVYIATYSRAFNRYHLSQSIHKTAESHTMFALVYFFKDSILHTWFFNNSL